MFRGGSLKHCTGPSVVSEDIVVVSIALSGCLVRIQRFNQF
jgi:hypothetical protein